MSTAPLPQPQQPNRALPPRLRAGDALLFAVQTALLPGTTLTLILTGIVAGTPTRITLPVAVIDANRLATFTVPSTVTAAWAPARYQWVALATDGAGNRDQIAEGTLRIDPDPAGATPADPRTRDERILDNIRAVLEGNSTDDVGMYKIGGRELTKIPRRELMEMQAAYESRVRRRRIARGEIVASRTIGIKFGGR